MEIYYYDEFFLIIGMFLHIPKLRNCNFFLYELSIYIYFLQIYLILLFHMNECFACLYACQPCASLGPEEVLRSSGTGVMVVSHHVGPRI